MRREFLKGYIMCLLGEGTFRGCRSLPEALTSAVAVFGSDFVDVGGEMLQFVAGAALNKIGLAAQEKIGQVARNITEKGLGAVFDELRAVYERGSRRGG